LSIIYNVQCVLTVQPRNHTLKYLFNNLKTYIYTKSDI
jgi:hypothetical protein